MAQTVQRKMADRGGGTGSGGQSSLGSLCPLRSAPAGPTICVACSLRLSARTLGSWPKWSGTQRPMASSTSLDEPAGMPMP